MEQKPFWQSKKFWMSVLGCLVALVPTLLGVLPQESALYGVLAAVAPVLVYINSQGKVDVANANGAAIVAASAANPPKPQP